MLIRTPSRRLFLGAAVHGLGVMMWGCGRDQRSLPLFPMRSGRGGEGGEAGHSPGGHAGEGGQGGERSSFGQSFANFGPLGPADENGVRVPEGFQVRVLARSGEVVPQGGGYIWHDFPDGGATFALDDGGHIYVSNSEIVTGGGVGALRFSKDGEVTSAYSICSGTRMNCQGGATPWGTFLTCEEVASGLVIECDPLGKVAPQVRATLGAFRHEGVAYDLDHHTLYLTEDEFDGRLYRYVPKRKVEKGDGGSFADLEGGVLQVARVASDGSVTWLEVPDPSAVSAPTRAQLPDSTPFSGGEGVFWQDGAVYVTTKGDDKVWRYDVAKNEMSVLYDARVAVNPILTGVDAIIGTTGGELLVAEDRGNMQVVVITREGDLVPLLQIDGQDSSEVTGIAFDPAQTRLYFSSQRGNGRGMTYEMSGPFAAPA